MLLVKTYEDFLSNLRNKYDENEKIICLLFLDPTNEDEIGSYLTRRFNYYHERSGEYVDFFCAGYYETYDKIRKFNMKDYVDFIKQLEKLTTWQYFGGTNLLLLRYSNFELHFDNVYEFNFTRMLIDEVVKDYRHFLDDLIRHLNYELDYFLMLEQSERNFKSLWENFSEVLPNIFRRFIKHTSDVTTISKYFSPKNIKK